MIDVHGTLRISMNEIQPKDAFQRKAHPSWEDEKLKILANINLFLKNLSHFKTEDQINTPEAEQYIKEKFNSFLLGCSFYMAKSDFEDLLDEVGNKKRDDGTIAWYHQLSPILKILDLVRDKVITLEMLEEYDGLEMAIRTALRHDSLEDFGVSFEDFEANQRRKVERVGRELEEQGLIAFDEKRRELEQHRVSVLMQNLRLMTKKIVKLDEKGNLQYHPDGRVIKKLLFPTTRDFTHNMVDNETASPIVFMLKQGDGSHNLQSMIGAAKFTPPRRLKYANEREDMFGRRQGVTNKAIKRWPEFEEAIMRFDKEMGRVLYINLGFSEYVDLAYPDDDSKHKEGDTIYPIDLKPYFEEPAMFNISRAFGSDYTVIDRIHKIGFDYPDGAVLRRTRIFLTDAVYPAIQPYKQYFPCIFGQSDVNRGAIHIPNEANAAPLFM